MEPLKTETGKKISLTGIKPTGHPHIGNLFGMIRPAIEMTGSYDSFYFIADYHALNSIRDPELLRTLTYEVAATWLACGLEPDRVNIYRQSDVPEIFELATLLSAFTPKGLMNRAHAYKASVDANDNAGKHPDDGVNMGLFTYPILMAADILMFDTDVVPIGRDQLQHLEMTVDIAQAVNANYGKNLLKIPRPVIREETELVIGLDGRKMSKSYGNGIEIFLPEKELRKKIMRIVTNSQAVEEKKDPSTCNVFTLYTLFATGDERNAIAARYEAGGMGWGEAKEELFRVADRLLRPLREKYEYYANNRGVIDDILERGAVKVRPRAREKIRLLRREIGIA